MTVSAQTRARAELAKVREQRATYLGQWAEYMETLTETLTAQLKEQEKALQAFQVAEESWEQQLTEATGELARLATESQPDKKDQVEPMEAEEMKEAEGMVATVTEQSQKAMQQHFAQQQALLEAMNTAQQNAPELAAKVDREGSRTPRRRGKVVEVPWSQEEDNLGPGKA